LTRFATVAPKTPSQSIPVALAIQEVAGAAGPEGAAIAEGLCGAGQTRSCTVATIMFEGYRLLPMDRRANVAERPTCATQMEVCLDQNFERDGKSHGGNLGSRRSLVERRQHC
jgi:hypothetical protein